MSEPQPLLVVVLLVRADSGDGVVRRLGWERGRHQRHERAVRRLEHILDTAGLADYDECAFGTEPCREKVTTGASGLPSPD